MLDSTTHNQKYYLHYQYSTPIMEMKQDRTYPDDFINFQQNVQKYIPNICVSDLFENWVKYKNMIENDNMTPNWNNSYLLSCILKDPLAKIPESLNISGCAIAIFGDNDLVMIGDENRLALTKEEQKEIGSAQPYTLPEETLDHNGNVIDKITLGRLIYQKQNKLPHLEEIPEKDALVITEQCIANTVKFKDRNFKFVAFRERKKRPKKTIVNGIETVTDEHPRKTFDRLLEEEFGRKFIEKTVPSPFLYKAPGRSSQMLVYMVHIDSTHIDQDFLSKSGKSNYFCAKSIPAICNNDYNETRNQRMVHVVEAYRILTEFGKKYKHCDLSRWGAIHLFETIIELKYGTNYLQSLHID